MVPRPPRSIAGARGALMPSSGGDLVLPGLVEPMGRHAGAKCPTGSASLGGVEATKCVFVASRGVLESPLSACRSSDPTSRPLFMGDLDASARLILDTLEAGSDDQYVVSGSIDPSTGQFLLDGRGTTASGIGMNGWNTLLTAAAVESSRAAAIGDGLNLTLYSVWAQ